MLNGISDKKKNKHVNILVLIQHSNMRLRIKSLFKKWELTTFNAFYCSWISNFNILLYAIVERGTNLSLKCLKQALIEIKFFLSPVTIKSLQKHGGNKRAYYYIYNEIDRNLLQSKYKTGHSCEVSLATVETCWNYAIKHTFYHLGEEPPKEFRAAHQKLHRFL